MRKVELLPTRGTVRLATALDPRHAFIVKRTKLESGIYDGYS